MNRIYQLYTTFQNDAYVTKKIQAYEWYIEGKKVKEISKLLHISRATAYRWIKQVREVINKTPYEWRKLKYHYKENTSRLGRRTIIDGNLVEKVLQIRRRYQCGKEKISIYLQREYNIKVSASTVGRILKRFSNVATLERHKPKRLQLRQIRNRRRNKTPPLRPWHIPKDIKPAEVLQVDTKYYITIDRKRYYLYAAIDVKTRMLYAMFYKDITSTSAADFIERAIRFFNSYGAVKYIQTDNGSEYEGRFKEVIRRNKIKHVHSQPRRPYQNGKVERIMRILQEEFLHDIYVDNIEELNFLLYDYLVYYNTLRVHSSISYRTPVEHMLKLKFPLSSVSTLLNVYNLTINL